MEIEKLLRQKLVSMRQRCNNPKNAAFYAYGARGINVCSEWKVFGNFKNWALQSGYKVGLTIERIDVNKGYSPENCTWLERSLQNQNKRDTMGIELAQKIRSLFNEGEKLQSIVKLTNVSMSCVKKVVYNITFNDSNYKRTRSRVYEGKKVALLNSDGSIKEVFSSYKEASLKTGSNINGISFCCNGRIKTTTKKKLKFCHI